MKPFSTLDWPAVRPAAFCVCASQVPSASSLGYSRFYWQSNQLGFQGVISDCMNLWKCIPRCVDSVFDVT